MNTYDVSSLTQLAQVAQQFAEQIKPGDLIFLNGDLGMGKTTFTQFLLKAAGISDHIKSPTYTLFEQYQSPAFSFVHMDLYRLSDPEELYFLGIEDLLNQENITLIEWPEKGAGVLPDPDWQLIFQSNKNNRTLTITSN